MRYSVIVIGGGLAGSEAAWQLAEAGCAVDLFEMRPVKMTEAHTTSGFAELVCSNSFGSVVPNSASQILKDEITALGSFVLEKARACRVPAGASLAVDRKALSELVTDALSNHPRIAIHRNEVIEIPSHRPCIMATGPLTSMALSRHLSEIVGTGSLYFYDAISPIVSHDSLDHEKIFRANRYDKGESADFLNVPLEKDHYFHFVREILSGEVVLPHDFEEEKYFEGCMPIEALAARGDRTLAFGPMKPVGLTDPKTGKRPYAVIQLRAENKYGTAYNLVGFQTKLKYKEQERIFRQLPGLEKAEFLRLGSMHRNTFLDSPRVLAPTLQLKKHPQVFIAGQLTGTEGYLESVATGLMAGRNMASLVLGRPLRTLPVETMLGSLLNAITEGSRKNFQPMNSNMGVLPPLETPEKDKAKRNEKLSVRSKNALEDWMNSSTESDRWALPSVGYKPLSPSQNLN